MSAASVAARVPQASAPAPNIVSARHLVRLAGGLLATTSRPPWPLLLRRTFDVDILECPTCGAKLRVRAVVTDPTTTGHAAPR